MLARARLVEVARVGENEQEVEDMPEIVRCPACHTKARTVNCRRFRRPPGREYQFSIILVCPECGFHYAAKDPDTIAAR